jgi:ABC-type transport system substrate-binding protein
MSRGKRILFSGAGALALGICVTSAPVWAADPIKQGGQITIAWKDDVVTLDPAIGYDNENWSMIKSMFSRLVDYAPGSPDIVKDLAEDMEISPDGRIYTFKLHHGVRFTNGRELTAPDVKFSLERTVNPKTQSPGASFFKPIKGYDEVAAGKSETLSGVTVIDPYTVSIELVRPDAAILHILAINFASVVPKEETTKWGADFGKHPVGSGPFKLAEWTFGQRVVLERNKDYYKPGVPYLDKIVMEVGQEPAVALLRLQRGEVDVLGNGIPPGRFVDVTQNQDFKPNIVHGPQLRTSYITMNVQMKPFDDVRVRRAVNMVIDKDRISKILNGRAAPANQPLPPRMPGFVKQYVGYPHDPAKAKELLKEAGLADGFSTVLYSGNTDPDPRIAQAIQQDLSSIGIKAEVKSLDQANVIAAGGEPNQAPMIWSGILAWGADFPDPSNFYGPILSCASLGKGTWNWAWYCNKSLEQEADEANAMVDPAKAAERAARWGSIYMKVMEDAPWVPVYYNERWQMHSLRVGAADALYVDPTRTPFNYDVVYDKSIQ